MMSGKNKVAYEVVFNGLTAIKTALESCSSKVQLHSIIVGYGSFNANKKEVQDYIHGHKKQGAALSKLQSDIQSLIAAKKTLFGSDVDLKTQVIEGVVVHTQTSVVPSKVIVQDQVHVPAPDQAHEVAPDQAHEIEPGNVHVAAPDQAHEFEPGEVHIVAPDQAHIIHLDQGQVFAQDPSHGSVDELAKTPVVNTFQLSPAGDPTWHVSEPSLIKSAEEITKGQYRNLRELQLSEFTKLLQQLIAKRDTFHKNYPTDSSENTTKAYGAAFQLVKKLEQCAESYKNGDSDLAQFKKDSSEAIRSKRNGVLSAHRGYKEFFANLLLAISTLGLGYIAGAFFTSRFAPIKLNTDTVNKLDQTQEAIEEIKITV
jgi:hypothetical protein